MLVPRVSALERVHCIPLKVSLLSTENFYLTFEPKICCCCCCCCCCCFCFGGRGFTNGKCSWCAYLLECLAFVSNHYSHTTPFLHKIDHFLRITCSLGNHLQPCSYDTAHFPRRGGLGKLCNFIWVQQWPNAAALVKKYLVLVVIKSLGPLKFEGKELFLITPVSKLSTHTPITATDESYNTKQKHCESNVEKYKGIEEQKELEQPGRFTTKLVESCYGFL